MRTGSEVAYVDSSALVKLALDEPQSMALHRYFEEWQPRAHSCEIARVEVPRAIRRSVPSAAGRASEVLEEVRVIELTREMLEHAAELEPPELRAFDAVHLAAAASLGTELDFLVTYDRRMIAAAELLDLRVESPA